MLLKVEASFILWFSTSVLIILVNALSSSMVAGWVTLADFGVAVVTQADTGVLDPEAVGLSWVLILQRFRRHSVKFFTNCQYNRIWQTHFLQTIIG